MEYTPEQIGLLKRAISEYERSGRPEWTARLQVQVDTDTPFEDIEWPDEMPQDVPGLRPEIRPETDIDVDLLVIPPWWGKGSGKDAWREFGKLVMEMEADLIDDLNRDDIIQLLEDRDIIDPPPIGD